jgi:hypothetical protein
LEWDPPQTRLFPLFRAGIAAWARSDLTTERIESND